MLPGPKSNKLQDKKIWQINERKEKKRLENKLILCLVGFLNVLEIVKKTSTKLFIDLNANQGYLAK